jgi:hypothetical protein
VRQSRCGAAFLVKAIDELRIAAGALGQHFHRNDAVERILAGLVDRRHRAFAELADELVAGDLAAATVLDLAADTLGLVYRDEVMFDEDVGERSLVGIGRLLLLLSTEFDFGPRREPHLRHHAADLGVEVGRQACGVAVDRRHVLPFARGVEFGSRSAAALLTDVVQRKTAAPDCQVCSSPVPVAYNGR